ncbi:MAG: LysR family transcriptional regulator [Oscillospiraceae bacterium]|nr:LysR family transcriptional regulator [Oscillospiraceae bacterium]
MKKMDLEYLYEFSVVAKIGSFTLAAEELSLSQSSLSKHILSLEKELNVKLFNRTTRKVTLSNAGKEILTFANQAEELKRSITSIATEQNKEKNTSLNIVSFPYMAQYGITDAFVQFQKLQPEINLTISECEAEEIIRLLKSGKCEIAFMRRFQEEFLDYITFFEDHLVAVLPASHCLSCEPSLRLTQLKDEHFLLLNKDLRLYNFCIQMCFHAGFSPTVKYVSRHPENIVSLVSQGLGIGLLMKGHTRYLNHAGVRYIDIVPAARSTVCLAKLKGHKLSHPADLFWEHIQTISRLRCDDI